MSRSRSVSGSKRRLSDRVGVAEQRVDEPARDRRGEQRVAGGDDADGLHEPGGRRVLEEEAVRAGPERAQDDLLVVVIGDDQDVRLRACGLDPADRLDPVQDRHLDVHQHDVGAAGERELDALGAVARLARDVQVGLGLQQRLHPAADELLIVDEDDPRRPVAHAAGTAWTPPTASSAARSSGSVARSAITARICSRPPGVRIASTRLGRVARKRRGTPRRIATLSPSGQRVRRPVDGDLDLAVEDMDGDVFAARDVRGDLEAGGRQASTTAYSPCVAAPATGTTSPIELGRFMAVDARVGARADHQRGTRISTPTGRAPGGAVSGP